MTQKIRCMALASAPKYKEAVTAAQDGLESIRKDKCTNFKVLWKPLKLDGEYHIRIYYDHEFD